MAKEYRGRIRILYDILHAANADPGIGVTRLLTVSNLSHDRLSEYLLELRSKGLLEEREASARKSYHVTAKGQAFLVEVGRIRALMADFGLDM